MYEPQLEAEALSEAGGLPTVRFDHAARLRQPLLVLVSVHTVQQVSVAGELDQIRMGGDQGLAPVGLPNWASLFKAPAVVPPPPCCISRLTLWLWQRKRRCP